ncbi:hypothetical protein STAQ_27640 [Allostella sp. ATCC 35155]|nr:hypothetical protein STAQ_27640 [Stella sp. ATCC 35155]
MQIRGFANPTSGYTETVGLGSYLLTLCLGPFFLAFRRAWLAALVTLVLGPIAIGAGIAIAGHLTTSEAAFHASGGWAGLAAWALWCALMQPLLATAYLKRGWREVG